MAATRTSRRAKTGRDESDSTANSHCEVRLLVRHQCNIQSVNVGLIEINITCVTSLWTRIQSDRKLAQLKYDKDE